MRVKIILFLILSIITFSTNWLLFAQDSQSNDWLWDNELESLLEDSQLEDDWESQWEDKWVEKKQAKQEEQSNNEATEQNENNQENQSNEEIIGQKTEQNENDIEQANNNQEQEQSNMQNGNNLWTQNEVYIADMQLTPAEVDDKWNISNSIIIRWELNKFVEAGENAILIVKFTPWKYDASQNKIIPDTNYNWTVKASDVKVYLINEWIPTEANKNKIMFIAPDWTQIQVDWKTEVDILNNALQIELDNPVWQELEVQIDFKNENAMELEKLKWNLVAEISKMKLWWTEDVQTIAIAQLPPEEIKPNQQQKQEKTEQTQAKEIVNGDQWIEENILFLIILLIITFTAYKMYYKE